jgi:tetratricopeptide (TPR) repeat protein
VKRLHFVFLLSSGALCAAEPSGWDLTAHYRFNEAREAFAHAPASTPADVRRNQLGEATALLNLQPRTDATLNQCVAGLEKLVAENAKDDDGITALYLLGRIEEIHRAVPNYTAARRRYTQLAESGSSHPLAQLGIVQLALLTLYRPLTPATPPAERLAAAEASLQRLTLPSAQSDLHLLLARSTLFFAGSKEKALEHFIAARKLGIAPDRVRADTAFSTAELARELGRNQIAIECYTAFLQENPRDVRGWTARQALAALSVTVVP